MKITITKEHITSEEDRITRYEQAIGSLEELDEALAKHEGKIVNKNFFIEHFSLGEKDYHGNERTKYAIYPSSNSYDRYSHYIHVGQHGRLELQNRETAHIRSRIKEEWLKNKTWIKEAKNRIDDLKAFDEKALRADLLALWKKHNKPALWREILEHYDVKWPEN